MLEKHRMCSPWLSPNPAMLMRALGKSGNMERWADGGYEAYNIHPVSRSTTGRHPRFISSCLHAPLPHAGTRTEELILVCVTM